MNSFKDIKKNLPLDYQVFDIVQELKSRKNSVFLIKKNYEYFVLKWFKQNDDTFFKNELNILNKKDIGFHIPLIISVDYHHKIIITNYIKGENLCDKINNPSISLAIKKRDLTYLADWFSSFHGSFISDDQTVIHGDAHLRNFILSSDEIIYGLDFEESKNGHPSDDIAEVICSILTTNPMFTNEKLVLSDFFFHEYKKCSSWKNNNFHDLLKSNLKKIIKRRNLDNTIFNRWNKKISNIYLD